MSAKPLIESGDWVKVRPRWTRQWVDGEVVGRVGSKWLVRWEVYDWDYGARYHKTEKVPRRRIGV